MTISKSLLLNTFFTVSFKSISFCCSPKIVTFCKLLVMKLTTLSNAPIGFRLIKVFHRVSVDFLYHTLFKTFTQFIIEWRLSSSVQDESYQYLRIQELQDHQLKSHNFGNKKENY